MTARLLRPGINFCPHMLRDPRLLSPSDCNLCVDLDIHRDDATRQIERRLVAQEQSA